MPPYVRESLLRHVFPEWKASCSPRWDAQSRKQLLTALRHFASFRSSRDYLELPLQAICEVTKEFGLYLASADLSESAVANYPSLIRRFARDLDQKGLLAIQRDERVLSPAWSAFLARLPEYPSLSKHDRYVLKVFALYRSERGKDPNDPMPSASRADIILWLRDKRFSNTYTLLCGIRSALRRACAAGIKPVFQIEKGGRPQYGLPLEHWPSPAKEDFKEWLSQEEAPWERNLDRVQRTRRPETIQGVRIRLQLFMGFRVKVLKEALNGKHLTEIVGSMPHIMNYGVFLSLPDEKRSEFTLLRDSEVREALAKATLPKHFNFLVDAVICFLMGLSDFEPLLKKLRIMRRRVRYKKPRSKHEKNVHLEDLQTMTEAIRLRAEQKEARVIHKLRYIGAKIPEDGRLTPELSDLASKTRGIRGLMLRLAQLRRDCLLIRQVTIRPLRVRNHLQMMIGTHLQKEADGPKWMMVYEREDIKALRRGLHRWTAPYPEDLTEDLERYLSVYRPCLLKEGNLPKDNNSGPLFITKWGNHLTKRDYAYQIFRAWSAKTIGKHVNPHLLRSVAEEALLLRYNGNPVIVADVLGITVETALKHYNPTAVRDSMKFWDELRQLSSVATDGAGLATALAKAATLFEEIARQSPRKRTALLVANHRIIHILVTALEKLGLAGGTGRPSGELGRHPSDVDVSSAKEEDIPVITDPLKPPAS